MPDESVWNDFFDIQKIFSAFGIDRSVNDVVEFGSGYGTFTIPISSRIAGKIIALEIEDQLVNQLRAKVQSENINNIRVLKRDLITEGSGIKENTIDFVMLFNILHGTNPELLLKEAYRILKSKKCIGIIHWNYDNSTPRGPPMNIRPRPDDLIKIAKEVGFKDEMVFDFKPYHYGITLVK